MREASHSGLEEAAEEPTDQRIILVTLLTSSLWLMAAEICERLDALKESR